MATFEEGVEQGRAQEKGRISALLALGEKSGALDLAMTAILADKGAAEMAAQFVEAATAKAQVKDIKAEEPPVVPPVAAGDGYSRELDYFLDCIREDRPPTVVTGAEALKSLALALAEVKSVRSGGKQVRV